MAAFGLVLLNATIRLASWQVLPWYFTRYALLYHNFKHRLHPTMLPTLVFRIICMIHGASMSPSFICNRYTLDHPRISKFTSCS